MLLHYRIIVVIMMIKKQSKQQFLNTHSSPGAVDNLPIFPSNYYMSHENAYKTEKEKLKEASKERKDEKQEDGNSLVTPQEQSCDETGM